MSGYNVGVYVEERWVKEWYFEKPECVQEKDGLKCEQSFLPLVAHLVGLWLCHLFLLELNAECNLFGSEEAAMRYCLKLHLAWLSVPAVLQPQSLNLPRLKMPFCLPTKMMFIW